MTTTRLGDTYVDVANGRPSVVLSGGGGEFSKSESEEYAILGHLPWTKVRRGSLSGRAVRGEQDESRNCGRFNCQSWWSPAVIALVMHANAR